MVYLSGSGPRGVVSWEPSPDDDLPTPGQRQRQPAYGRSVAWAIAGWVVTVGVVYVVSQVLGFPQLGGWVALAGVIIGGWFGGKRGGINGRRGWVVFGLVLLGILILAIGLGGCVYAMALYG
jgi:hypothetical protein